MKASAFYCDYKHHLVDEKGIVGINPIEDMFDRQQSYPICHQNKTDVHFCTECYNEHVLRIAGLGIDRKKDEHTYMLKVKELGFAFRSKVVSNHWAHKRKHLSGSKTTKKKSS